jgi:tripartite-type tricarboxylate transporter receptor subunit TctC
MSAEVVATLNRAIKDAVSTPEAKRFFGAYGSETGAMTPGEFDEFAREELKRWDGIIKMTGLQKQ